MSRQQTITVAVLVSIILASCAYGGMIFGRHNVKKPAASEFGLGPRASAQGLYKATLHPTDTLKPRKMYVLPVAITDANGKAVTNATIAIDGGMPQHGHGLPTKPRITKNHGNGTYEISGLRFNMGGWWELKLTITTPAGTDTVTFNLSL
ncbi:MAG TPA: FixH family protein [Thermoanaerobaculia bacterium]|jgi:hypothetical protein